MKRIAGIFTFMMLFVLLTSCNIILRPIVNRKFPPLSISTIRDSVIRQNLRRLENVGKPTYSLLVKDKLSDLVVRSQLESAIDRDASLGIKFVDSVYVSDFGSRSNKQLNFLKLESKVFFDQADKLRHVKFVQLCAQGFLSPQVEENKLRLNPGVQRVQIQKVKFKNVFVRLFTRPIKRILNNLLHEYNDNLNGVINNATIPVTDSLVKNIRISEIIKSTDKLKVVTDDTLEYRLKFKQNIFLIDSGRIIMMGRVEDVDAVNTESPVNRSTEDLFEAYRLKFNEIYNQTFLGIPRNENHTAISRTFVTDVLGNEIASQRFAISYDIVKEGELVKWTKLTIFPQPVDCHALLGNLIDCARQAAQECPHITIPWTDIDIPEPTCFQFKKTLCELDFLNKVFQCQSTINDVFDFLFNNVGKVKIDYKLRGNPIFSASNITIGGKEISIRVETDSNGSNADVILTYLGNGLPSIVVCNIPAIQESTMNFNLSLRQIIDLHATYSIDTPSDSTFRVKLNSDPLKLRLEFSPSIAEQILTRPEISLNCTASLSSIGLGAVLAGIASVICGPNDSKFCVISNQIFEAVFESAYTHNLESQEKSIPIYPPRYHVDGVSVKYITKSTDNFLLVQHKFAE